MYKIVSFRYESVIPQKFFGPPPPQSQIRSYGLDTDRTRVMFNLSICMCVCRVLKGAFIGYVHQLPTTVNTIGADLAIPGLVSTHRIYSIWCSISR